MARRLAEKIAVVTGGTTGIGFASAKRFAAEGARVFITGRRQAELDEAVAGIGANATGIQADSTKMADLNRLLKFRHGRRAVRRWRPSAGLSADKGRAQVETCGPATTETKDEPSAEHRYRVQVSGRQCPRSRAARSKLGLASSPSLPIALLLKQDSI